MQRLKIVFIVCFALTLMGCVAVKKSLDNYQACKGDQVCMAEMSKVREASYVVAKTASGNIPIPSVPEIIAVIVSNIVSFGYGVLHGKKKTS